MQPRVINWMSITFMGAIASAKEKVVPFTTSEARKKKKKTARGHLKKKKKKDCHLQARQCKATLETWIKKKRGKP